MGEEIQIIWHTDCMMDMYDCRRAGVRKAYGGYPIGVFISVFDVLFCLLSVLLPITLVLLISSFFIALRCPRLPQRLPNRLPSPLNRYQRDNHYVIPHETFPRCHHQPHSFKLARLYQSSRPNAQKVLPRQWFVATNSQSVPPQ